MRRIPSLALAVLILLISNACTWEQVEPVLVDKTYPPATPYSLEIPPGLPPLSLPTDNPLTEEGIQLGRMLFYDPIMSLDSTISCNSCHKQEYAFSDGGKVFSEGVNGQLGDMNSMALINLGWRETFFWDGRAMTLAHQAEEPIRNPVEMMETWANVINKLANHPEYPDRFGGAFGDSEINIERVTKAIEQFELTLISANSLVDRFREQDQPTFLRIQNALNMFNAETGGDCFHCHQAPLFTSLAGEFHNNGLDSVFNAGLNNLGHFEVTGDPRDIGRFNAPTLRNIALTGPYMHDGRFQTLREVLEHYSENLRPSLTLSQFLQEPADAVPIQIDTLNEIIFLLESLTDTSFINDPRFSNPFN